METQTIVSPDVTIDLNDLLDKFMAQRMDVYQEPKNRREGKPFLPIYAASILALTTIPLADQANTVGIGCKTLKSARTTAKFKGLVAEHVREFGGEVFSHILSAAIVRTSCMASREDGDKYRHGDVRWVYGKLSWDAFVGILASLQVCFRNWQKISGSLTAQYGQELNSTLLLTFIHLDFVPIALSMARQHYKVPKREIELLRDELFNGLIDTFSRTILDVARLPDKDDEELVGLIRANIKLLIREHNIQLPKLAPPVKWA